MYAITKPVSVAVEVCEKKKIIVQFGRDKGKTAPKWRNDAIKRASKRIRGRKVDRVKFMGKDDFSRKIRLQEKIFVIAYK